jgi:hypothetical protein
MTDETNGEMKYDVPIRSPEHAAFCRAEAERRYRGKIVRDGELLIVVDEDGNATGTDAVLRALSFYAAPIDIEMEERDREFLVALSKYLAFYKLKNPDHVFYMVLNDGETFTGLDGCRMISCPTGWTTNQIEMAMKDNSELDDDDPTYDPMDGQAMVTYRVKED